MKGSVFDFDPVAQYYDAWYDDPVGAAYDRFEKLAVDRLLPVPAPGATLLEAGCGTGHWSEWFAGRGYCVTGIDVSAGMTAIASAKNIPGAKFYTGDFLEHDFTGAYDVVAAITSLEFMTNAEEAVERMRALVRPGGCLVIGVLNRRSWLGLARKLKRNPDPLYASARFFTTGELRSLLKSYGTPRIAGAAFALPYRSMLWSAGALETTGSACCPCLGNFIAGAVTV